MKKTVHDIVKETLEKDQKSRNSDKRLYWVILYRMGLLDKGGKLSRDVFLNMAINYKSMHISRQQIQQKHRAMVESGEMKWEDSLLSDKAIDKLKQKIADEKGTHHFREVINEVAS